MGAPAQIHAAHIEGEVRLQSLRNQADTRALSLLKWQYRELPRGVYSLSLFASGTPPVVHLPVHHDHQYHVATLTLFKGLSSSPLDVPALVPAALSLEATS